MALSIVKLVSKSFKEDNKIPFFATPLWAGFPSAADDFLEKKVSVEELLVKNPTSTYFFKVRGNSLEKARILDGDILVVDSSLEASHNSIIVGVIDGEFTVKRIVLKGGKPYLKAESYEDSYDFIENVEFEVWGVCTYVIHSLK